MATPARQILVLYQRLVGLLPDALHAQTEQDVAHGGVGRYDDLVHVGWAPTQVGHHLADSLVDGRHHRVLQLSGHILASFVGNPVHDVAATELLGILEAAHGDAPARFEVDQLEDHRGRTQVHRQTVDSAAVDIDLGVPVPDLVSDSGDHGLEISEIGSLSARLEYPRPSP